LAALAANAQLQMPDGIKFNGYSFTVDNIANIAIVHYDDKWGMAGLDKGSFIANPGPKPTANKYILDGKWSVKSGVFHLNGAVSRSQDGGALVDLSFKSDTPVPTRLLAANVAIPIDGMAGKSIIVDGTPVKLPELFGDMMVFRKAKVEKVVLMLKQRTLEIQGKFELFIQDNRKFNGNSYSLRLYATPSEGSIAEAKLNFSLKLKSIPVKMLNLRSACNMGFVDDVADDGQGGWTDQGPDNDLRLMATGKKIMGGITFDVIDPKDNGGKSCLVLGGEQRAKLSKESSVDCAGMSGKYLYLLHASAWNPQGKVPIGDIVVTYADGQNQTLPVTNKLDVANWWTAHSTANAAVVWTAENPQAYVGLFLSAFKLSGDKPVKVSFKSRGNAVWMIVGASMADQKVDVDKMETVSYVVADRNWMPLQFSHEVKTGSALDFSCLQDAPAGKYGPARVMASGGIDFTDRPGQRVRFFGPNLCFSANYLSHEESEALAERLAKTGYNSVRFHHFDRFLAVKGAKYSYELDPVILEQMDYLFACMKKRGIYVTIDLYCSRQLKDNEIPEFPKFRAYELKALAPLLASVQENWKIYVRNLLCRKNQYTGMTWAEDPALFLVNLVNEDTIFTEWKNDPVIRKMYEDRFKTWVQENGVAASTPGLFNRFLSDIQAKFISDMTRFLREEIKLKSLITDNNFISYPGQTFIRSQMDLVDNHQYWDHQSFPDQKWQLPYGYNQRSALAAQAMLPRQMMPSRVFGKPFMVTEFNYCFPNRYRAEGGPLIGAYAGLQDWDGLYRFAWAHDRKSLVTVGPANGFDASNEPLNLLADKLSMLLFLRYDVAPAKKAYAWVCNNDTFKQFDGINQAGYPDNFSLLGLRSRIGSVAGEIPAGASIVPVESDPQAWKNGIPAAMKNVFPGFGEKGPVVSDTGEIALDAAAMTFRVVTPRSEALVVNQGGLQGKVLSIAGADIFQTVAVSALDGQPLNQSAKILVFQLTDIQNSKTKYGNSAHTRLENWGELPLLLRRGKADVTLALTEGRYQVTALALDGSEKQTVASQYDKGELKFTADTGSAGGTLVYLVTRQ